MCGQKTAIRRRKQANQSHKKRKDNMASVKVGKGK